MSDQTESVTSSATESDGWNADHASASGTSIESILSGRDAADVPASSPESHDDYTGSQVPLERLRSERERLRKTDAEIRAIEQEIEKYNAQKWGFEESDQKLKEQEAALASDQNQAAGNPNYDKSFNAFVAKHGKERVNAVNTALNRLDTGQREEMYRIAATHADPAQGVTDYVERLGLLDPAFAPMSIKDVLAGKGKQQQQPAVDTAAIDRRLAALDQREYSLAVAEQRAVQSVSRNDFIAEFGRDSFNQLDAAAATLIQSQPRAAHELAKAMQSSQDPIRVAAEFFSQAAMWSPSPQQQQQQQRAPMPQVFPSNLAGARNVGSRSGPAWSGPTPIKDIFDRRNAAFDRSNA